MNNRTPIPAAELNPLEQAYRNYQTMEELLDRTTARNRDLEIRERALAAEVEVLSEMLKISDSDRIRLQHVASSLMGQLRAINSVIADAVQMAVKQGVEAAQAHAEAQGPASEPAAPAAPEPPAEPEAAPVPRILVAGTPLPPPVFRDVTRTPRMVPRT